MSQSIPPLRVNVSVPPSQLHQRTLGRHFATAPRPSRNQHNWTMTESYQDVSSNMSPLRNTLRRNLFSQQDQFSPEEELNEPAMRRTATPQRADSRAMPKRGGNGEFCGLTAEITRELLDDRRSIKKTPRKTPMPSQDLHVDWDAPAKTAHTPPTAIRKQYQENISSIFRISEPHSDNMTIVPTISVSSSDDLHDRITSGTPEKSEQAPSVQKKRGTLTPIRLPRRNTGFLSSAKKLKKCLTPPREGFGSHWKTMRSNAVSSDLNQSPNTLSTALPGAEKFKIHSTEYEPFDFQCELPSKREVTVHAKICHMVDTYTAIHRNFNFAMLAGLTRVTLKKEYDNTSEENPMIAGSCHRDVVKMILDCEEDLVVEGFFREYVKGTTGGANTPAGPSDQPTGKDDRIEVVIFSSEKLRQLIVCFRGSTASQAKPLKINMFGKNASSILHEEQPVNTLTAFRDAYFGTPMEDKVFALLANLATRKPFFDVVMTGHSFGATLATIGALRYAKSQPMMRVSCQVFGCPRIGGEDWRQLVHSIANLKIFRAENVGDPYVSLPSGSEWVQVGHAISFVDSTSRENSASGNNGSSSNTAQFVARRFDRDRVAVNNMFDLIKYPKVNLHMHLSGMQGISAQGKSDHQMQSYVDKLTKSGDRWFTDFSGMKGNGVISFADNERRLLS